MAGRRASVFVFVSLPVLQGVLGLAGFSLVLGWTRRSDWNQKGISPQNSKWLWAQCSVSTRDASRARVHLTQPCTQ